MAAPTIANTYTNFNSANGKTLAVTIDAGSEGDLLLIYGTIDGNQTTSGVTLDLPAEVELWVVLSNTTSNVTHCAWRYQLGAGDTGITSITMTWDDTNEKGVIFVDRIAAGDHDGVDVFSNPPTAAETDAPTSPSVVTTVANCRVIVVEGHDGAALSTHPGSTTEVADVSASGGGLVTMSSAHFEQVSAGATGAKAWAIASVRDSVAGTIAIAPAGGGGGPSGPSVSQKVQNRVRRGFRLGI